MYNMCVQMHWDTHDGYDCNYTIAIHRISQANMSMIADSPGMTISDSKRLCPSAKASG